MADFDASVIINIAPEWLAIAAKFAAEQTRPAQQNIIFRQTLAILALQKYLDLAQIETALTESYSWHPQTRVLTAWADLLLPQFGRLLCCFTDASQRISLPPILPLNTFGFVVIEINIDTQIIYLKGFLPYRYLAPHSTDFLVTDVQLIATLFDELYLLAEKRILVKNEIQQLMLAEQELQDYLSTFLVPEQLLDIINRLNRSFALDEVDSHNLLLAESAEMAVPTYAVTEAMARNYPDNLSQEKIVAVTHQLTQSLFSKIRELHQDFGLVEGQ